MIKIRTEIIKISDLESGAGDIMRVGQALKNGLLAAFPTETVYGLGANALDERAVAGIFAAKGRPQDNPLIIHVPSFDWLALYCHRVPKIAKILADAFWPGPLTLIVRKNDAVPDIVTAGLKTVAVRCPAHPIARALIEAAGVPIAAPSANRSGRPSTTSARHVIEDLSGRVAFIIDGGDCGVGLESTTIDLTVSPPRVLRPGGVTLEQLRDVLGDVEIDPGLEDGTKTAKPKSPGMKYRHYAPIAPLTAVCGQPERSAAYILENAKPGDGVLCYDEFLPLFSGYKAAISFGRAASPEEQAHSLFDALRRFDSVDVGAIFAQCPGNEGLGYAIANRIKKAAGNRTVNV